MHPIARLRSDLGISQVQLAELTGVHEMTVSKWERGVLKPHPFQASLLSAYRTAVATDKYNVVSLVESVHKRLRKGDTLSAVGLLLSRGAPKNY